MAGSNLDMLRTPYPAQNVQLTYLGGLFNGEQVCVPTPTGDVQVRRATLVRLDKREDLVAPVTFADETYHLAEVAPGWWVGLHQSIRSMR